MKCPLIAIGYLASNRLDATEKSICGEEKCAWWDNRFGVCSVKVIKKALVDITEILARIADKMPYPPAPEH